MLGADYLLVPLEDILLIQKQKVLSLQISKN